MLFWHVHDGFDEKALVLSAGRSMREEERTEYINKWTVRSLDGSWREEQH